MEEDHSKDLDYAKAKEQYALKEYEREAARRDSLQTKAQLYLSLFTAFLGAVFLSQDQLKNLGSLLSSKDVPDCWKGVVWASLILLAVSLIVTLASAWLAFRPVTYEPSRPNRFSGTLFPARKVHPMSDSDALEAERQLHEVSNRISGLLVLPHSEVCYR